MKYKIIVVFLLLTARAFSQPYGVQSDGKDIWVGYMFPSYNKVANSGTQGFYGAYLLISSYTQNKVTIEYFDRSTGIGTLGSTYTLSPRTGTQIQLPLDYIKMGDTGDKAEYAAVHVTAQRAINVEFFSTGACSGGSFLPITSAGLGTKYVISSYFNNPGNGGLLDPSGLYPPKSIENSYGFFEIVSPSDNTLVTITPNSSTQGGHSKKVPYTISLARGQCYLVKSSGDDPAVDISGSLVESDKPIAVIAGHENATLGAGTDVIVQGVQRKIEARDFMVEQMYPVTMWDTGGYVMIPLRDSPPADPATFEGVGEKYRIFAYDTNLVNVNLFDACNGQSQMATVQLAHPPPESQPITCPVDFESVNKQKFSVMMYDLRNFANAMPYPAPSMITVIPMSRWKTSYLWYVPANKFEILQGYYVDIIAQDADFNSNGGIVASFNGGTLKPLRALLSLQQQWKGSIPNHPGLTGMQFKLSPGSYYASGPHPFIVYNFGFRALDPNYDLGDFDGDDYFFSYGSPAGLRLGGAPHLLVKIDTSCDHWNVCVHDSSLGLTNQGIKSISLIDDPTGDEFDVHPGRVFYNTRFDDSLDPDHKGQIDLTGNDTDFCFKVNINNIADTGYAPLFIVDDQGGAILVELHSKAPKVKLIEPDSGRYLNLPVGKDSCETFIFKNTANTGGGNFAVNNAYVKRGNFSPFHITSSVPPLPVSLKPGDSIIITTCFTPKDTTTQEDTILLLTACQSIPIPLIGSAGIPIIWASDHDFGAVLVDSTKCDTVGVYNIGKYPFTLTKDWVMANYGKNFRLVAGDSIKLISGITIPPKGHFLFTFCYTPHSETLDSATMNWGTTLQDPYKHSNKDFSKLYGHGVKSGFVWDRIEEVFLMDSLQHIDSLTIRALLYNNSLPGSPQAHVDKVYLRGQDSSEFHVIGNERGYPIVNDVFGPPGFDIFPNPGNVADSGGLWVDVKFKPDLTKPFPQRFADRHAELVASGPSEQDQIVQLTGTWSKNDVKEVSPPAALLSIYPNPATGTSIIVSVPGETKGKLVIYDVLGREVYRREIVSEENIIPVGSFGNGLYYARLVSGSSIASKKFEIAR